MNPNTSILERLTLAAGFVPINMASGANAGDWISMKNYQRILIVLLKGAGAAGQDPTITVEQATTSAGAGNKALNFSTIYSQVGTLANLGQWTKTTQAAGNTYVDTVSGEAQAIICIEIMAEDLDLDNDYDFIQASVADVGSTSQIGTLFYICADPRYMDAPENMLTPLA